jgi:iron complex outermembrane receptor protein
MLALPEISSRARLLRWAGVVATGLLACAMQARAQATVAANTLADLSLEQLREVVVSTVSRADETLGRAPAAIYVISAEDIRAPA